MKYIFTFNENEQWKSSTNESYESSSEISYYKVSNVEYFDKVSSYLNVRYDFSEYEIMKIMGDVNIVKIRYDYNLNITKYYDGMIEIMERTKKGNSACIRIYKMDDEWYWMDYNLVVFYKCDQFEGLLQCLDMVFDTEYNKK